MSDNVNITPGTGVTIATRDTGAGVEVQRVIPNTWNGTTATDVATTNPLPVVQTGALPVGTNNIGSATLKDGVSGNLATVAALHNSDNQSAAGFSFGILTGGVAQLINAAGNLDRQRETGADGIPALGIATGTQQLASPFPSLTSATTVTASGSPQAVTPSAMSGTVRGSAWSIQVGSVLTVGSGAQQESVVVTTTTGTTFSAVFTKNKSGTWPIVGYVYNQARDATAPDGSNGAGFAAGATFLYNGTLNAGSGGWEGARSASGELDGASGAGTNVAVEYFFNGLYHDRSRSVQGKAPSTINISSGGGVSSTSVTLASAPTGLQPGSPVLFNGGTAEVVYTASTYTAGTNPVTLATAIANASHTSVTFEAFSPAGPGLSGFTGAGMGITEDCVYDPVSGLFYIERAATQDNVSGQNVVLTSHGLFNGTNIDRQYNNTGGTALSLSGRTTSTTSTAITNFNARGAVFFLNVTAASGTGGLTFKLQHIDPASANAVTVVQASSAINATGVFSYSVYPGASASGSGMAIAAGQNAFALPLPRNFQVLITHGDASNYTYSVGYSYIV